MNEMLDLIVTSKCVQQDMSCALYKDLIFVSSAVACRDISVQICNGI